VLCDERIGPPVHAFLHHVFATLCANNLFRDFYLAGVMETMIGNAVQKVGRDEGIRKLLQIGVRLVKTAI
jgi:hypothetical protein